MEVLQAFFKGVQKRKKSIPGDSSFLFFNGSFKTKTQVWSAIFVCFFQSATKKTLEVEDTRRNGVAVCDRSSRIGCTQYRSGTRWRWKIETPNEVGEARPVWWSWDGCLVWYEQRILRLIHDVFRCEADISQIYNNTHWGSNNLYVISRSMIHQILQWKDDIYYGYATLRTLRSTWTPIIEWSLSQVRSQQCVILGSGSCLGWDKCLV